MLKSAYETLIIGSGFGGAITAYRLAEAEKRTRGKTSICVLERGRRYHMGEFPRQLSRPKDFWWREGGKKGWRGLLDFRTFPKISILQASGVGGTSLIYANVQHDPFDKTFDIIGPECQKRWPAEIHKEELRPYFERVKVFLRPSPIPDPPMKTHAMQAAAEGAGVGERFRLLDLAIYWGKGGSEKGVVRNDPYDRLKSHGHSGPAQTGCAYCGECFTGCNTHSKNTLDLNYLWLAERLGVEVHSQHKVTKIEPFPKERPSNPDGYNVYYEDLRWDFQGVIKAKRVIVASGSLGSTELLLRCKSGYWDGRKKVDPTLPGLSDKLGHYFSGNGDIGAVGFETNRIVNPMDGPTITSVVDYGDRLNGLGVLIEEGGFPDFLRNGLRRLPGGLSAGRRLLNMISRISSKGRRQELIEGVFTWLDLDQVRDALPFLTMGVDAADGTMTVDAEGNLQIDWDNEKSMPLYREIERELRELTESRRPGLDGNLMMNPVWSSQKQQMTPHPLGGCPMGEDITKGVVSARGEVFGYKNLYVADGSILPSAIGPNPSRTIGALAERIAEKLIQKEFQS